MAAVTTLSALLGALTQSIASALEATSNIPSVDAPKDGISLLDVKNELLLSYLQNLVFLILVKVRIAKQGDSSDPDGESSLDDEVVKKLVELRLYLEKGVRPMEDKLRYQIEKVLRAADDAERNAKAAAAAADHKSDPESECDSDEASDEDEANDEASAAKVADLAFRPNMSALVRPFPDRSSKSSKNSSGVYKAPKIAPTSMPTTETRERRKRGPIKSATMDEFIADEMSSAPLAQPSIGTNIVQFGRRLKTAGERKDEDDRRNYEERNFVRLAKASKTDRAKQATADARRGRMNYGGEEFRDISTGADRINRMTKKKDGGGGTRALLEKSRKRGPETTDGPRGTGNAAMGERYEKRLKTMDGGRRDRGKGR